MLILIYSNYKTDSIDDHKKTWVSVSEHKYDIGVSEQNKPHTVSSNVKVIVLNYKQTNIY